MTIALSLTLTRHGRSLVRRLVHPLARLRVRTAARVASAAVVGVLVGAANLAGAQTSGGAFSGSVLSGAATPDVLPLTLADAVDRGLKFNLTLITLQACLLLLARTTFSTRVSRRRSLCSTSAPAATSPAKPPR